MSDAGERRAGHLVRPNRLGDRRPGARRPGGRALGGWMLRSALVLTGAFVGVLLATVPAAAHNELVSSNPTNQQRVDRTPSAVVLTFNEPAVAMGTQVVVTGPAGPVQLGVPQLVDNSVTQPLQGGAAAGTYTVSWRVTSADGHPISGELTFTAAAAGAGQPSTPPPGSATDAGAAGDGGSSGLVVALSGALGVAVVAGVVVWLARRGRRA
jgi:hypothetical protein